MRAPPDHAAPDQDGPEDGPPTGPSFGASVLRAVAAARQQDADGPTHSGRPTTTAPTTPDPGRPAGQFAPETAPTAPETDAATTAAPSSFAAASAARTAHGPAVLVTAPAGPGPSGASTTAPTAPETAPTAESETERVARGPDHVAAVRRAPSAWCPRCRVVRPASGAAWCAVCGPGSLRAVSAERVRAADAVRADRDAGHITSGDEAAAQSETAPALSVVERARLVADRARVWLNGSESVRSGDHTISDDFLRLLRSDQRGQASRQSTEKFVTLTLSPDATLAVLRYEACGGYGPERKMRLVTVKLSASETHYEVLVVSVVAAPKQDDLSRNGVHNADRPLRPNLVPTLKDGKTVAPGRAY